MSQTAVDRVFDMIERLAEEDRLALEKRIAERLAAEWDEAVAENRRVAQERGITDETIERAIHRRRYGG